MAVGLSNMHTPTLPYFDRLRTGLKGREFGSMDNLGMTAVSENINNKGSSNYV
jgi:hypothetical protein